MAHISFAKPRHEPWVPHIYGRAFADGDVGDHEPSRAQAQSAALQVPQAQLASPQVLVENTCQYPNPATH